MLLPKRLHRKMLRWLCVVVFAANFLGADAGLDLAWPLLGTASQESTHQRPQGASQEVYEHLTFGLASAQAAPTGAKERAQVIDFFKMAWSVHRCPRPEYLCQLADCFRAEKIWEPAAQGKVTHWNQIHASFPNQPLLLYGPGRDSGTFDYFTLAIVGAEGKSRSDYTASEDDVVLVDGVSSQTHGLGYFGYAYYLGNRDRLKAVAIDSGYGCVSPSPQTVADSSYQPLSRPIFIYVKQSTSTRPEVKAFTDFYLEPRNSSLVIQVGYVPLPTLTLRAAISRFNRGMTGSAFGGTGSVLGVNQTGLHEREQ